MQKLLIGSLLVVLVLGVAACASMQTASESVPKGVDLVIQALKVVPEDKVVVDGKFSFEITVKNIGDQDFAEQARAERVEIYEGTSVAAFSQKIPALKAGEECVLTLDNFQGGVMNLSYKAAGDHTYSAQLKLSGAIAETNTENNQMDITVKVEEAQK